MLQTSATHTAVYATQPPEVATMTQPQAGRPQMTPNERLAYLQEKLPGWHVWHVSTPCDPGSRYTWSAMPHGAVAAVCTVRDDESLLEQAREYQAHLPEHIADTRTELDNPETDAGRKRVLQAQLSALLALAMTP